jgi:23S rRNA pseudouridine2605 synthase
MATFKTKKTAAKKSVAKKTTAKKIVKSKKTAPLKPELTEAMPEQAADLLNDELVSYQGTTLVVPQEQQNKSGALAPAGASSGNQEVIAATEAEDASKAAEPEFAPAPRPPAKLERLQKILARAGVASRRSAEVMIEQGRVQVNGKVVTVLGSKADASRDHIRVDGKLLQGPERHRYFVLNKPRGFVTTVKDPEGRPTVMQFFDKMKERLYPVGRLDYMSEGLLVVTNDGELANRLTKASSGVEKTYLVKVAGQPTEAELNILRGGVAIERGKPGSPPVRTAPARIRQVRQGDNPWYEVVLTEGRNREIRKMFEEVGHFVEKIRRVGYGPLVLDQEPGNLRELQPEELAALRRASDGTLRTPKAKELRRRNLMDAGLLPTVLPKPSGHPRTATLPNKFAPAVGRLGDFRPKKNDSGRPSDFRPKKFGAERDRTSQTSRPAESFASGAANKLFRPARPGDEKFRPAAGRSFERPSARPASHPAWKKDDRPTRPPARFAAGSSAEKRPGAGRPFTAKPAWKKPERPAPNRREARVFDEDLGSVRPPNLHIEEITGTAYASTPRPSSPRASSSRPNFVRPARSEPGVPMDRSSSVGWKGGPPRPFTTSSGKPRAGGPRPGWKPKPNRFGKHASSSSRPFTPRTEGASVYRPNKSKPYPNSSSGFERKSGPGWKPKTRFGPGKPEFGSRSGSKPGGFSKPGGPKRSGPRPFGNRPGGKPGGKKRR